MMRIGIAAGLIALSLAGASASEIVWKGGATATATTGCTGWDPVNQNWWAYYYFPLAGTDNQNTSDFSLHDNGAESFDTQGTFVLKQFVDVRATHIYTLSGQYDAQLKLVSLKPAPEDITVDTINITGRLIVKGFDNTSACNVTIDFALTKHIEN